jgi:hypothetical protein
LPGIHDPPIDLRRIAASHAAALNISSPPAPTPTAASVVSEDLQLEPLPIPAGGEGEAEAGQLLVDTPHGWLVAFRQGNTRASRKQVKPRVERMVAAFLAD